MTGDSVGSLIDQIIALLSPRKPKRIVLGLPVIIRNGKPMANFELTNDTVAFIPIHTIDANGDLVPAPVGDVFSALSSDLTKMIAAIGTMPSGPLVGAVALVLTPLVQLASALTATVTDTAALTSSVQTVDIVGDLTPKAISLDIVDVVLTPQAVPPA